MSEKDPDVVVSDAVQWFSGSAPDVPLAAIVTEVNHNGMLSMLVINQDGFPVHKRNVWPVGHQMLRDNQTLFMRNGAWKFGRQIAVSESATEAAPFDGGKPAIRKKESAQTTSV